MTTILSPFINLAFVAALTTAICLCRWARRQSGQYIRARDAIRRMSPQIFSKADKSVGQ
jgi:hypothetical protein